MFFFYSVVVDDNDDGDVRWGSTTASDGRQWFRRRVSIFDKFRCESRLSFDGGGIRKHMIQASVRYMFRLGVKFGSIGSDLVNSIQQNLVRVRFALRVDSVKPSRLDQRVKDSQVS
ncbi:hypothetical protein Hanom_Chr01g00060091 [Helianthus anomalus]